MKIKREYVMTGMCAVSVAAAVGSYIQLKKTASLLKKTVKELAEATPVEIEKDVVDAVVQEALEMKVDSQVDDILEETRKEISKEIRSTVLTAVSAEMGKCHEETCKAYEDKVKNLTTEDVREMVVKKSSAAIEKKLEGQFDDILRNYERRLDEVNRMYTKMISQSRQAPNLTLAPYMTPGLTFSLNTERK